MKDKFNIMAFCSRVATVIAIVLYLGHALGHGTDPFSWDPGYIGVAIFVTVGLTVIGLAIFITGPGLSVLPPEPAWMLPVRVFGYGLAAAAAFLLLVWWVSGHASDPLGWDPRHRILIIATAAWFSAVAYLDHMRRNAR
jgi:hypothetical protein